MNETEARKVVLAELRQIAPEADPSSLEDDVEFREQFDIDSMDFLNFITGLHSRTGVDVPEEDYPQLATLAGCIAYLVRHTGG